MVIPLRENSRGIGQQTSEVNARISLSPHSSFSFYNAERRIETLFIYTKIKPQFDYKIDTTIFYHNCFVEANCLLKSVDYPTAPLFSISPSFQNLGYRVSAYRVS
ncbi:hypothetical protein L2E82_47202 [Cichorium intybus]|uniref:Uncharacterized protein n=1 Tax=Cichorium intybus TaxID=13427 RepID=A0ACB8YU48_CICIN|nr:hypothetical protein L2E82_47202 [Cichorium intybus]